MHDWSQNRPDMTHDYWVPEDNFTQMYEHQRPPLGIQVWIGATDPNEVIPSFASGGGAFGISREDPSGRREKAPLGYTATVVLGRLVFKVLGRNVFMPQGTKTRWNRGPLILPKDLRPGLLPIWKRQGRMTWPPAHVVTRLGLGAISAAEMPTQLLPGLPLERPNPPQHPDPFAPWAAPEQTPPDA
jgi:hypothetical protein